MGTPVRVSSVSTVTLVVSCSDIFNGVRTSISVDAHVLMIFYHPNYV